MNVTYNGTFAQWLSAPPDPLRTQSWIWYGTEGKTRFRCTDVLIEISWSVHRSFALYYQGTKAAWNAARAGKSSLWYTFDVSGGEIQCTDGTIKDSRW